MGVVIPYLCPLAEVSTTEDGVANELFHKPRGANMPQHDLRHQAPPAAKKFMDTYSTFATNTACTGASENRGSS